MLNLLLFILLCQSLNLFGSKAAGVDIGLHDFEEFLLQVFWHGGEHPKLELIHFGQSHK